MSDLIKANRVIFDLPEHGGSYMEHRQTGGKVRIHQDRGVFHLIVWYRLKPLAHLAKAKEPIVPMEVDAINKPTEAMAEASDPFEGRELTPP